MSRPNRLLVVSIDAMQTDDIEFARTLPHFARILGSASTAEIEAVFPTVTYPNHTAQITGCSPGTSGIFNNLQFQPGRGDASDWFWDHSLIRVPSVFAAAKEAGCSVAAVQWPVTVGADSVDWLVPEAWSWQGRYESVESWAQDIVSENVWEQYVQPHLEKIQWEPKRKFNEFGTTVAEELIRHERPEVLFFHLVELDSARHAEGPYGRHVEEALRKIDGWLGRLFAALDEAGTFEETNIVLVSDHGHLGTEQHTNLNVMLIEQGFIRIDEDGGLIDYDAFCLGAGLSGQIMLAEDLSEDRRGEVEDFLAEVEAEPEYRIEKIWTAEEAQQKWGLSGPFSWVVESEPGVIVGMQWDRRAVVRREDEDFQGYLGNHGHAPQYGGQPVFIASGPDIAEGVDLGRRSILDEAPTFARLLGVELPDAEGVAMSGLLCDTGDIGNSGDTGGTSGTEKVVVA